MVYKNSTYYEEMQADKVDKSYLKPVAGSSITGYKNGVSQGVMFEGARSTLHNDTNQHRRRTESAT